MYMYVGARPGTTLCIGLCITRPPSLSPRTVTPTGKNYTLQFTPSVVYMYRFTHR